MNKTFDNLFLLGLPAAGKAEFIELLKATPEADRGGIFHIIGFEQLDDYPWLWEKFLEDDLWEKCGHKRRYSFCTDDNYAVLPDKTVIYDMLIAKFNKEIEIRYLARPNYYTNGTVIIKFSRGGENGYQNAFGRFSEEALKRTAIIYIKVGFNESWRRNVARFEETLKHTSLFHMVPREVSERIYKTDDWDRLTNGKKAGKLMVKGVSVPFVTVDNEPEIKDRGPLIGRYKPHIDHLHSLWSECETASGQSKISKLPDDVREMRTFDHLFVLGIPASGKSEFIDFMRNTPDNERAAIFSIGRFEEVDDFPWLWEKFLEDNEWEESGINRLFSHCEGNNIGINSDAEGLSLFDLLMARINKDVCERYLPRTEFYRVGTLFIEFSRGVGCGYRHSFPLLDRRIFERAAILYVEVTPEEAWKRNVARYNEKLKHSILAHKVTDRAMGSIYKGDDWAEITGGKRDGYLKIHGINVPFVTMPNEPELPPGPEISKRYKSALNKLFSLYRS